MRKIFSLEQALWLAEISNVNWYSPGAYLGPNWVYALKGFHGAFVCIKCPSGEQGKYIRLNFFLTEVL